MSVAAVIFFSQSFCCSSFDLLSRNFDCVYCLILGPDSRQGIRGRGIWFVGFAFALSLANGVINFRVNFGTKLIIFHDSDLHMYVSLSVTSGSRTKRLSIRSAARFASLCIA